MMGELSSHQLTLAMFAVFFGGDSSSELMVNGWFGSQWFGIRIGVPPSNNPFHEAADKGMQGIQTTGPQANN